VFQEGFSTVGVQISFPERYCDQLYETVRESILLRKTSFVTCLSMQTGYRKVLVLGIGHAVYEVVDRHSEIAHGAITAKAKDKETRVGDE
jgi:hypothetical protein